LAKSSLTAAIAGLPSVLVMAAVLQRESGDWTSPACHDRLSPLSDFAEPSAHYSVLPP
jgi:hypothetical protein